MPEVELSAGPIEYEDAGSGPPLVFLHGLLMDSSQWRHVLPALQREHRCIAPTLPIGAHRRPMHPDADLSLEGQARIVIEFLERLELDEVTLIGIDTGAGLSQLVIQERPGLVSRLVLISAEAFDNYPPGLPGNAIWLAAQAPGGVFMAIQSLRLRPLRRLPFTFGWMSKRLPDETMDAWFGNAIGDAAIRRDMRKYVRGARAAKGTLVKASEAMASFDGPTLIVWATEDRIFPIALGRRLAETIPNATLVEVEDSYTLITEDQPAELCRHLEQFLASTLTSPRSL